MVILYTFYGVLECRRIWVYWCFFGMLARYLCLRVLGDSSTIMFAILFSISVAG